MARCPVFVDGTHRGPTCACGFEMVIPPYWVQIEVGHKDESLFADAFNCNDLDAAIRALRGAADKLERQRV